MRTIIVMLILACKSFCYANSHHPADFIEKVRGAPDEGAQIVASFCQSCHAPDPMIRLGAPRIGIKADWQNRIDQNISVLFSHIDEGLGAMPQRGGCFECSDEQLWLATLAMLPENQQGDLKKQLKKYKNTKK